MLRYYSKLKEVQKNFYLEYIYIIIKYRRTTKYYNSAQRIKYQRYLDSCSYQQLLTLVLLFSRSLYNALYNRALVSQLKAYYADIYKAFYLHNAENATRELASKEKAKKKKKVIAEVGCQLSVEVLACCQQVKKLLRELINMLIS